MLRKIKKIKKRGEMNKIGVSEMVSYVILISIAIGISVGVYAWMKSYAVNPSSVDCKEGTSVTIQSYECFSGRIELTIKNNGRFNISGVVIAVSNDSQREPQYYLNLIDVNLHGLPAGHYFFSSPLKPGAEQTIEFSNKTREGSEINTIKKIDAQPFIIDDKNHRVLCLNSVMKQNIENCNLS